MKKLFLLIILSAAVFTLVSCGSPVPEKQPESSRPEAGEALSFIALPYEFTAEDIYGKPVTEAALGEKQVFFIHYWGTWCPPCVKEMPDLAGIARAYGDRVGFLGLVDDYASNLNGVVKIVESAEIPEWFIMVDADEPSLKPLRDLVRTGYAPSTVLITQDGVSEPLIGAFGGKYGERLDSMLERGN